MPTEPPWMERVGNLRFKLRVLRFMVTSAYEEWRDSVWKREPDAPYCCDGRECGCGGSTVRELWGWYVDKSETGQ